MIQPGWEAPACPRAMCFQICHAVLMGLGIPLFILQFTTVVPSSVVKRLDESEVYVFLLNVLNVVWLTWITVDGIKKFFYRARRSESKHGHPSR